jgi:hypothetical protein
MYLFGGVDGNDADPDLDEAPGDEGAGGTMDGSSIIRATWHQNGTIDGLFKTGTGAHSFLPFTGFNRHDGLAWTLVGLTYTATAADAGQPIGIGFWANEFGAVDDVALTSLATPGDYDGNGSVGPEDYELWKITYGEAIEPGADADGNRNGRIDVGDYTVWRDNLAGPGGGALAGVVGAAAPEPHSIALGLLAAGAAVALPGRRRD